MTHDPAAEIATCFRAVADEMARVLVGQQKVIEAVCAAFVVGGHVLLEGYPGTAKTLLARAFAAAMRCSFTRIQFTPDLMPADITGTNVFNPASREFEFRRGPVFTDVLLADEINRAPSKTQAALLEAMQEQQVTVDGQPYQLSRLFMVLATQNPIEYEGTYPLPEAQLDRFMIKVLVEYPSLEDEQQMLQRYRDGVMLHDVAAAGLQPRTTPETVLRLRQHVHQIRVEDSLIGYITEIVRLTRRWPNVSVGASPRAAIGLLLLSKALAGIRGRSYVVPDDVKSAAPAVLRHRLLLTPEAEIEGVTADNVATDLLKSVTVPK
jgi:MoxR-like ATPase